jgi:hypothetical protein
MLAFIAVAMQEIRVPVSLVARLLFIPSNSQRQELWRAPCNGNKERLQRLLVMARISEVRTEEEKCRY